MVKADAKHDYYADLEVPPTADAEAIKKQFRILAKQYHPDRNPGKETEVVAKFQAVQAAHEILSDPLQKSRYDADRARYIRKTEPDPYAFKRANTARPAPPPPAPPFPPSRARNSSVDRSQFTGARPQQPSSASAEKFAAFTRPGPQHWDRAKFDDAAAKAEALRNFQSMRGNPPPQRAGRAPTAPRPASTVTSPDFTHATAPSPGFPGLSRTNSGHHRTGFSPATAGRDEPAAKSAYAYVHSSRDKGPGPAGYTYQGHPPPQSNPTSPQAERSRVSGSPLRQSKSSHFDDYQRPPLGRAPSRYATSSGEKTNINGFGLGRSASVRNSPVEKRFPEHGPFGVRDQSSQEFRPPPPPRNHSASPKVKPQNGTFEYSASDSSSSEDERSRQRARPKATPRQPLNPQQPHQRGRQNASNDPALTGHFSNKNYTRLVEESQYTFPPPETENVPHRRPFEAMTSPVDNKPNGLNDAGPRSQSSEGSHMGSHSNSHSNGTSNSVPPPSSHHASSFSASEWDGKFSNGDNVFIPNERDRRSPTKSTRSKTTSRSRSYHTDIGVDNDSDSISPTMPEPRKVHSYESPSKAAAFQPDKFSAENWSEKIKPNNAEQPPRTSEQQASQATAHKTTTTTPSDDVTTQSSNNPDAMDIDSKDPDLSAKTMPPPKATSRRLSATTSPNVSAAQPRRPSDGGISLADLANTVPLKASADGLDSLATDLGSSLPFKSRPADQVQLTGPSGAALRNMSLPKPPKPILRPEKITQDTWENYSRRMQQYMRDWGSFNAKMIEHFRIRQEQINHKMYQNWVMGEGEGANAQDVDDGTDIISPPGSAGAGSNRHHPKAGYLTYMQWLEQDALCRRWWDMASEEHRECLDGLGSMRRAVKAVRDQEEAAIAAG